MKRLLIILPLLALSLTSQAQTGEEALFQSFLNPEKTYRPRVWWHWMNGNITRESIRKDILWMDRAGLAGFHNFDAGLDSPQIVCKRLIYMTPEWKEVFNYALDLADSLDMEVSVASSPGWSITGGPWVSEDDAEKKIVWRETVLEGGRQYTDSLPDPFVNCGPYQEEPGYPAEPHKYEYYKDLFVLAVPVLDGDSIRIAESRIKAGFDMNYKISDRFPTPETQVCPSDKDVLDITHYYKDGILDWAVPDGKWKVFRFGYNLLGRRNAPASPEATGLEVDKLDPEAVRRYYDHYLGMYQEASGGRLGKAIHCLMIDSYESGHATWTIRMEREFERRRGYELRPWMPVLTGQILGSSRESEQFLFDWRQTLGELMAENHYDIVDGILDRYGMTRYTEAHEERQAFTGDGMRVKLNADVPMSAIWARYNAGWHSSYPGTEADVRESSSVAHIYGQNICAAESFTTNGKIGKWDGTRAYQCGPYNLKPLADAAMSLGLNRFVIHSNVHQPDDNVFPGLGLGVYGQWFNRHETWAEEARGWTDYLSRSSYLLQQGRWVADIAYFYGEDKNLTGRFYDEMVNIPKGWNYDFVNADIILNVFRRKGNTLVTSSGMQYRMLVLDNELKYMSFPVLKRIARFVRAGVPVCCLCPPVQKAGYKGSQKRFDSLVAKIWDKERNNVFKEDLFDALNDADIRCDVDFMTDEDADLRFVHRRLDDGEIYWIANITPENRDITVSLNVDGYFPEIWHADTGLREPVSYRMHDGRTEVDLSMTPDDAQFIMLLKKTDEDSYLVRSQEPVSQTLIDGDWTVSFQQGRGAPESAVFHDLHSYTEEKDEGIRYFSGTAYYEKSFEFHSSGSGHVILDLGDVSHMARVYLNGEDLGLIWKAPYRTDVTDNLVDGTNKLIVKVINSWANRLIGDAGKAPEDRITYTVQTFYLPGEAPVPSGLMGPVKLIQTVSE